MHSSSKLLILVTIIFSLIHTNTNYGQASSVWRTVWLENFNGLTPESHYNSGADPYYNNPLYGGATPTNGPQNSVITGSWDASNTYAGITQSPSWQNGGRFLMYWTDDRFVTGSGSSSNPQVPAADSVFFRKTIDLVYNVRYRMRFKYAGLRQSTGTIAVNNPAKMIVYAVSGNNKITVIPQTTLSNTAWTTTDYYEFLANGTPVTFVWVNKDRNTYGNDFAIDDLVVESLVYNISGNVYNDVNGLTDNQISGTMVGSSILPLYANLISNNLVIATVPVNSSGSYTFTEVFPGNYSVVLSHITGNNVQSSLPSNWSRVG